MKNMTQWLNNRGNRNNTQESQNNTEMENPSESPEENATSQQLGYITSDLLLHYDGIANNKTTV